MLDGQTVLYWNTNVGTLCWLLWFSLSRDAIMLARLYWVVVRVQAVSHAVHSWWATAYCISQQHIKSCWSWPMRDSHDWRKPAGCGSSMMLLTMKRLGSRRRSRWCHHQILDMTWQAINCCSPNTRSPTSSIFMLTNFDKWLQWREICDKSKAASWWLKALF